MADPFAAFADPFAAFAEPYQPPAGHSTASMLSTPSAPYAEGVDPKQSFTNKMADAMEPYAHPSNPADFAALLIPGGAGGALGPYLKPIQEGAAKYGGAAVEAGAGLLPAKARAALKVLGELKPSNWNSPFTAAGREGRAVAAGRAFNDLPLAQQMDHLPETPAPATTRGGDPPYQPQAPSAAPSPEELRAAGVGEKSIDLMRRRQMGPITPIPSHPPAPTVAPMPSHAPVASVGAPTERRMGELMQRFGGQQTAPQMAPPSNVADVNLSVPAGDPKVTNLNPKYPWTPEQSSQIRLGMSDWHSGAPSGTPAARAAQGAHIEDHVLNERYRQLLSDPKAALLLPMLAPAIRKLLLDQMQGSDTQ